jgi:hypothetical protein
MPSEPLKRGDKCPRDGGSFKAARIPTDAEYAKAFDRENPGTLPEGADSASADFRAEHGELHRCTSCGYQTRFPVEAQAAAPAAAKPADQPIA